MNPTAICHVEVLPTSIYTYQYEPTSIYLPVQTYQYIPTNIYLPVLRVYVLARLLYAYLERKALHAILQKGGSKLRKQAKKSVWFHL